MSALTEVELQDYFNFLRFASVSTKPKNRQHCLDCAEWIKSYFSESGLSAELRDTGGLPAVVAKNEYRAGRPTILLYGHYDVQPEDPVELWESPPFEPLVKNGVVYARGATDNKGQIFAHMLGWRRRFCSIEAPVNIIFLVEGEEEIGSPNLAPFLEKHREEFRCDAVVLSDTGMLAEDIPTLTYGLRGIAAMELRLQGPERDLHSGIFGGAVLNPLLAMSKLLAALHDDDWRVRIPGFYEGVRGLEPWESGAWAKLPLTEKRIKELVGSSELWGEAGYGVLERMWARPTAEVNGLWGGYQGTGSKTIIPSEAHAKLTFRLVPNQDPPKVLDAAEDFFRKNCPAACRLEIHRGHSGRAYFLNPRGELGKAAVRALRAAASAGAKEPALICEGGSVPIVSDFQRILGASSILVGLALPDCRIHSPNENFHLSVLEFGVHLHGELLMQLAQCGIVR